MFITVPTYRNGEWSETSFETREDFRNYLLTLFREPGQYGFDETSKLFQEQSDRFNALGYYTDAPFRSKDFVNYWDQEKKKCRNGVIFVGKKATWYLTRDYYMWLNFLPIYDKEEKKYGFAKVRDAQYHMEL